VASDYLQALRAMSRLETPAPPIKVLSRAQDWAASIDWTSSASAMTDLERTHALLTPAEADEHGVILRPTTEFARAGGAVQLCST
jgi:hypothetical protein